MSNAAQFRSRTAAILVGRTLGEKPDSYQEAREMVLPNSHLKVRYSTQYYRFVERGENSVRPDHEVPTSWEEIKAGRDPVLEWARFLRPYFDPSGSFTSAAGPTTVVHSRTRHRVTRPLVT